jgi:hypothetical protein
LFETLDLKSKRKLKMMYRQRKLMRPSKSKPMIVSFKNLMRTQHQEKSLPKISMILMMIRLKKRIRKSMQKVMRKKVDLARVQRLRKRRLTSILRDSQTAGGVTRKGGLTCSLHRLPIPLNLVRPFG